jgi:DNA-binding NtrC family response regulator
MITGYGSIESAIESMKRGAADYILKPIENAALLSIIRKNLEFVQLKKDNTFLKHELLNRVYGYDLVTQDPEFLSIIARADQVKNSSASILIEGESGTGKEVLARYIHFTSNRKDAPS